MEEAQKKFTLWDHLTGKDKVEKVEDKINNLLKLYLGDFIIVKGDDGKKTYEVKQLSEYDRLVSHDMISDGHLIFTDYLLHENDGHLNTILRATQEEIGKIELLWLDIYYNCAFDESIFGAAKSRIFKIDDDDGSHVEYESVNPGDADVVKVKYVFADKMEEREVKNWGFFRNVNNSTEYFFVEIDDQTGWITMLKGMEISMHDIEIIPK